MNKIRIFKGPFRDWEDPWCVTDGKSEHWLPNWDQAVGYALDWWEQKNCMVAS